MLVHPRPMCPRPKILGCCIPWTKCSLSIVPLTEPSHLYCRGLRPGILDAVHALRPERSDTHALCGPCVTRSRVGTHRSGAQDPRDALFKGCNIQELSVGDTSVGDTSTLHRLKVQQELGKKGTAACRTGVEKDGQVCRGKAREARGGKG